VTGQLAFDLPVAPAYGRRDFFVSDANRSALAMVEDDHAWPVGRMVLSGPPGSGKTHLAAIWAGSSGGRMVAADALDQVDLPSLARTGAVVVDDADNVAGQTAREAALFHLCNLMTECGGRLLLTGTASPRDWGMALPDLVSRVQASGLAKLMAPDDSLLSSVLIKLFADRQVMVDPSLVSYLVSRMNRTFAAARTLVDTLDRMALERGAPISRALAADALSQFSASLE
jgi:chromosomal replication initiation ATPase DnaA